MLIYFIFIGQLLIYIYKKRKILTTLTFAFFISNLIYLNFDEIRYKTKYDKNGNKYVIDMITGKKWKTILSY